MSSIQTSAFLFHSWKTNWASGKSHDRSYGGRGSDPGQEKYKGYANISFAKTIITFEPLQLHRWERAHFEALEQLFLTVPNNYVLVLQERI